MSDTAKTVIIAALYTFGLMWLVKWIGDGGYNKIVEILERATR